MSEEELGFVRRELEAVTAERDELQARIDAYEGNVEAWEEMSLLIKASSLGTPEAESLADKAPPGVGRAITLGAQYLERAEKAEAMLGAVSAHNAELQEELDVLKQRAIPEAAAIMNELTAERDRLRVVVTDVWSALFAADRVEEEVELLTVEHAAMLPGIVRAAFATANEARGTLEAALHTCPHYGERCLSPTCAAARRRTLAHPEATDD